MLKKFGIIGSNGRLGKRICDIVQEKGYSVSLFANKKEWKEIDKPDVVIDVSNRTAFEKTIDYCLRNSVPLVEGVSGLGTPEVNKLKKLSKKIPVVLAPNFSYGHNLQIQMLNIFKKNGIPSDEFEFSI